MKFFVLAYLLIGIVLVGGADYHSYKETGEKLPLLNVIIAIFVWPIILIKSIFSREED